MVCWYLVSWVLYIFWRLDLCQMWSWWKYFPTLWSAILSYWWCSSPYEKLFSFMRFHLLIVYLNAFAIGVLSVQEVVSCANVFKNILHFLFYQDQYIWFYVEAFNSLGREFSIQWSIWIYLHSSTCQHPIRLEPCIEDAFFVSLYISGFLKSSIRYP